VVVGDIVKLSSDEVIPADILLLNSSDSHDICFIETANLDGETNLKQREVVKGLFKVRAVDLYFVLLFSFSFSFLLLLIYFFIIIKMSS